MRKRRDCKYSQGKENNRQTVEDAGINMSQESVLPNCYVKMCTHHGQTKDRWKIQGIEHDTASDDDLFIGKNEMRET